ncbi:50S ribosomal protein L25/general stress protein Ctc [Alkalicoccobacillus gibsonii]|jgi:large subunit ribosomal protein L25|uniref:Large ribosomal subunit protein bL25 n=1 Tax=Alkalicoccobacillus gibsonii TaxID=79881 RepID=A0ABU9VCK0_9BACI|nr:50S ribosomal protein L25/general stress protein Ctc [Alkalicoccobacillus gibsonii]MBM0067793.1 50S ribosomal protein L25/general stress protein Ctc [Alkalicoccobacillus gibsonii]
MTVLKAEKRTDMRGSGTRKVRNAGYVPGVLYGNKTESTPVSVESVDFLKTMREVGRNGLFSLEVSDGKKHQVMVQEVQTDPLKDSFVHIDFFEVDMKSEIDVEIPVRVEGEAAGVKEGGVLAQVKHEISVRCLPGDIPEEVVVDVSELGIGDGLTVADVKGSLSVEVTSEDEEAIVTVQPPTIEPDPDEEPEEDVSPDQVEATEERKDENKDGRVE